MKVIAIVGPTAVGKTALAIELARELAKDGVMVYFIVAGEGDNYKVYYSAALAPMLKETTGYIAIK